MQADTYSASRVRTTRGCVITSNTWLAAMPGHVSLPAVTCVLPRDSVVNVTGLVTVDKDDSKAPSACSPITSCATSTEGCGECSACERQQSQHTRLRAPGGIVARPARIAASECVGVLGLPLRP